MNLNVETNYPVKFELIEQAPFEIDNRFRKCKIYICHEGENLNASIFPEETLHYMGQHLSGVAIVGMVDLNKFGEEDFRAHEMIIEKVDGEYKFKYLCVPFGCVLENNNAKIEELDLDGSGQVKKWLTCEGILYNRFKDCIDIFERDGMQKSQSMELEETSCEGYFQNKKFVFSKAKIEFLTILGNDVTPAMAGSHVTMFSSNEFKTSFSIMLNEINESLKTFSLNTNSQEGGNTLEDNKTIENIETIEQEPVAEEFATVVTTQKDESSIVVETIDTDSYKIEETKVEKTTVEITETQDSEPVIEDFTTEEPIVEEPVVETIVEENPMEESFAKAKKDDDEDIEMPMDDMPEEDMPMMNPSKKKKKEKEFNVLETEEYKALETKFNALIEEIESLRTFKANKELEDLKSNVDTITSKFELEESEISELKAKAYNKEISLEVYEEKLFALVGKKNFSKIEQPEEKQSLKFSLKATEDCPYPTLSHLFK